MGWSRSGLNRKITPRGRNRKASGLGQKCAKPEDYSKRKKEESKRVGVKEKKQEDYSKWKKEERKRWLKPGKSICIIGMLSKKQRQIRTT